MDDGDDENGGRRNAGGSGRTRPKSNRNSDAVFDKLVAESPCPRDDDIGDGSDGFGDEEGMDVDLSSSTLDLTIQKLKCLVLEERSDNSASSPLAIQHDDCDGGTEFTGRGIAMVAQAERNKDERDHQIAQPPRNPEHERSDANR